MVPSLQEESQPWTQSTGSWPDKRLNGTWGRVEKGRLQAEWGPGAVNTQGRTGLGRRCSWLPQATLSPKYLCTASGTGQLGSSLPLGFTSSRMHCSNRVPHSHHLT